MAVQPPTAQPPPAAQSLPSAAFPPAAVTAAAVQRGPRSAWRWVVLLSIALTAVAAFLPWVSVLGISVSGINGDGQITLGLTGLGILTWYWVGLKRWVSILSSVLGALVCFIGFYDLNSFAAGGLYLTVLAGGIWAICAALAARSEA